MVVVKLRCDSSVSKKLKTYNIDKRKLENFLQFLTNNIKNFRKHRYCEIKVKGIPGTSSQYFWGENEIEVALQADDCKTQSKRRVYFLQSLVHEYRHWVQSELEGISQRKLNYTEEDIENGNDAYKKNKYELECVEWENLIEKFNKII